VLRQGISLQDRYMGHKQNIRHSKFKYKGTKRVFSLLALWNSSESTHLNSFPDMAVEFIFEFPPP